MDHIQKVTLNDEKGHFTVTFKWTEQMKIIKPKWKEETWAKFWGNPGGSMYEGAVIYTNRPPWRIWFWVGFMLFDDAWSQ